jgi:hypothetical protein
VLFAIIPIPFAMVSLALAGQSLIMPLTGVSVVMNQVLAPAVRAYTTNLPVACDL